MPTRPRMGCDPDDIRLLLGYTIEEIERMDRAVEEIIRQIGRTGLTPPPRRKLRRSNAKRE
jgi:hypothetical protein